MDIDRSIYPMPAFATLRVADLERSTRWYVEGLGFEILAELPGPGGTTALVHLRRARYQDLLLVSAADGKPGLGLSFAAGDDDLARRAKRLAGTPGGSHEGPQPTPWRTLDLVATDPDGNQVTLTQLPDEEPPGPLPQTDNLRRKLGRS